MMQVDLKRLLWGCVAFALGSCSLSSSAINDRASANLVLINYGDRGGHGTGFVVRHSGQECWVLTAAHVVRGENSENLNVTTQVDQVLHQNPVVKVSDAYDIALLRFIPENANTCPYAGLPLGNSDRVEVGAAVFLQGYPQRSGQAAEEPQFEPGTVSGIETAGISYALTSAYGMSGGPVMNAQGQVIGIHSHVDVTDAGEEHFKGGIPLNLAKAEFGLESANGFEPIAKFALSLPWGTIVIILGGGSIVIWLIRLVGQALDQWQREAQERQRREERDERQRQQELEADRLGQESVQETSRKNRYKDIIDQAAPVEDNNVTSRRGGSGEYPFFVPTGARRSGLGIYQDQSSGRYFLFPTKSKTSYDMLSSYFDLEGSDMDGEVEIIQPAIVIPSGQGWQLDERGIVKFPLPRDSATKTHLGIAVETVSYITAKISADGKVTSVNTKATIGRYTETRLYLPRGAVPLHMVAIPGGTFTMGSPENEANRSSAESPQHSVTVPNFLMGQYAVSQAQWFAVMGQNYNAKGWQEQWKSLDNKFKGDNLPIVRVSWDDANTFIQRLNEQTGKTYRLPTEAEWEYAARAGTQTPFSYGDTITPDVVNYDGKGVADK